MSACVIDVDFQSSNEPIFKIENSNNKVTVMMIVPIGIPTFAPPQSRISSISILVDVLLFFQIAPFLRRLFLCVILVVVTAAVGLSQRFIGIVYLFFFVRFSFVILSL